MWLRYEASLNRFVKGWKPNQMKWLWVKIVVSSREMFGKGPLNKMLCNSSAVSSITSSFISVTGTSTILKHKMLPCMEMNMQLTASSDIVRSSMNLLSTSYTLLTLSRLLHLITSIYTFKIINTFCVKCSSISKPVITLTIQILT